MAMPWPDHRFSRRCRMPMAKQAPVVDARFTFNSLEKLERARRIERPTLTLARLCSTPELRPRSKGVGLLPHPRMRPWVMTERHVLGNTVQRRKSAGFSGKPF